MTTNPFQPATKPLRFRFPGPLMPSYYYFWWKVDPLRPPGECWRWLGHIGKAGYGITTNPLKRGGHTTAHRVAYMLTRGPVLGGQDVMHSCDNRWCVNPIHLTTGTRGDNMADCRNKQRHNHGEKHGMRKLTDEDVIEIRRLRWDEGLMCKDIAEMFDVTPSTISVVSRGIRVGGWSHIPMEVAA